MRAMHLRRRAEDAEHATQGTTSRANPCLWLAGGAVLFFLVPLVGTDMLGLQPDLYRQRRRRWPGSHPVPSGREPEEADSTSADNANTTTHGRTR